MKTLILFLCLISCCVKAQNYQCLQYGVKHYFTNDKGYLRGIRIDSVHALTDSVIYYPFHTPRGSYSEMGGILDSNGGSWLGKKVVQTGDGSFLFDNIWGATVMIKTKAHLGDSWTLYSDTTARNYRATVTGLQTMPVLGVTDSVKIITINAFDSMTAAPSDPLNNFKIILSKNNGFVQVCDLYTFPYHVPDSLYRPGLDFYLDKSTSAAWEAYSFRGYAPDTSTTIFHLVNFINPTRQQLYDFSIGDIYEYKECNLPDGIDCDISLYWSAYVPSFYQSDTIINKYYSGSNIVYEFNGSATRPNPFALLSSGTGEITVNNSLLIDTTIMPEEYHQQSCYYYVSSDSGYCLISPYYETVPNYLFGINFFGYDEFFIMDSVYKKGLGLVKNYYKGGSVTFYEVESSELTWYRKSTDSCGGYSAVTPVGIQAVQAQHGFTVFPNPAHDEVNIKVSTVLPYSISILNMFGQTLLSFSVVKETSRVDVSNWPKGMYFVQVTGNDGCKNVEKVVVE